MCDSTVEMWMSPADRRAPFGTCGQSLDNALEARCPPPAHTRAPLAHKATAPATSFYILRKRRKWEFLEPH